MNNAKNKGSFGRKTSIREMFAVVFVFVFFSLAIVLHFRSGIKPVDLGDRTNGIVR